MVTEREKGREGERERERDRWGGGWSRWGVDRDTVMKTSRKDRVKVICFVDVNLGQLVKPRYCHFPKMEQKVELNIKAVRRPPNMTCYIRKIDMSFHSFLTWQLALH